MNEEKKEFIRTFDECFIVPAKEDASRHLARHNALGREELYNFILGLKFEAIADGGFKLEYMLKRKKITAIFASGKSTADAEFALEIIKMVIESSYFGYSSSVFFGHSAGAKLYRAIKQLQEIVVPHNC